MMPDQDSKSKNASHHQSVAGESSHSHHRHHDAKHKRKISDLSQGPGLLEMVAGDGPEDEEEGNKLSARSSSIIKFYPDWCKKCSCTESQKPLTSDATRWDHTKSFFSCPPKGTFGRVLIMTMVFILGWGFSFYLFRGLSEVPERKHGNGSESSHMKPDRDRNPAWIKGPIFALLVILATGLVFGLLIKRYLNLPPLLAPLVIGIICKNVDALNLFDLMKSFELRHCKNAKCEAMAMHSVNAWIKPIRIIALGLILTRAGLELSPKQMKKLKGIVPLLAFGPCIVEACVCASVNYVFFNVMEEDGKKPMSLAMCFVGGFALAAVSPAVVVPGALSLKKKGYGVVRGVPTLLIAASSIDDVLAISCYSIALGFAVQSSGLSKWQEYCGGILGIAIGLVHGVVFGMILHFLPPKNSKSKAEHRIILVILINLCSVMAYEETFYSSAGSISVLVTSFIAGFGWRSQPHWKRPMHRIEKWLALLWTMWVPLLFGTIGKEIDLKSEGFHGRTLYMTFGVIAIALVFRLVAAYFIAFFATKFNCKECLFVALSWIPKATVQAALAPLVLTRTADDSDPDIKDHAKIVVNVAILAVLITAPIGSCIIALVGPKLLEKQEEALDEVEIEFPNGEGIDPAESTYHLIEKEARRHSKKMELEAEIAQMEGVVEHRAVDTAHTSNQTSSPNVVK